MAKVTVLTAVYNAESYLRQCLDSLKNQTLTDCQFLCIDDCSTDGSHAILQEYAQKDARFQLIQTLVNSGISVTRNLGIEFASGEYITTLDADDWFAPDLVAAGSAGDRDEELCNELLDDIDYLFNKVKCRKIEMMMPQLIKMVESEMEGMRR